jgi:hypothetical protein
VVPWNFVEIYDDLAVHEAAKRTLRAGFICAEENVKARSTRPVFTKFGPEVLDIVLRPRWEFKRALREQGISLPQAPLLWVGFDDDDEGASTVWQWTDGGPETVAASRNPSQASFDIPECPSRERMDDFLYLSVHMTVKSRLQSVAGDIDAANKAGADYITTSALDLRLSVAKATYRDPSRILQLEDLRLPGLARISSEDLAALLANSDSWIRFRALLRDVLSQVRRTTDAQIYASDLTEARTHLAAQVKIMETDLRRMRDKQMTNAVLVAVAAAIGGLSGGVFSAVLAGGAAGAAGAIQTIRDLRSTDRGALAVFSALRRLEQER